MILCNLRFGLCQFQLRSLSFFDENLATIELHAGKALLLHGHVKHLAAIKHLKILGYNLKLDIILGDLTLFGYSLQVCTRIIQTPLGGEPLKEGKTHTDIPAELGSVTVSVGVFRRQSASEAERLAGTPLHLREKSILSFSHGEFGRASVKLSGFDRYIMFNSVVYATVKRPTVGKTPRPHSEGG